MINNNNKLLLLLLLIIIIDNFIKKTIKILFTINSLKKKKKLFIQKHYLQFLSI